MRNLIIGLLGISVSAQDGWQIGLPLDADEAFAARKYNEDQVMEDIEEEAFDEGFTAGGSIGDLDLWNYNVHQELPVGDFFTSDSIAKSGRTGYRPSPLPVATRQAPVASRSWQATRPVVAATPPPANRWVTSNRATTFNRGSAVRRDSRRRIGYAGGI